MRIIKVAVSDDIHAALTEHARADRRSLVKEAAWILEDYAITHRPQARTLPVRESTDVNGAA
jgi:hypothetical protein